MPNRKRNPMPTLSVDQLERFHGSYTHGDGCWEWNRELNNKGYGLFRYGNSKWVTAHRLSFSIANHCDPIASDILHRCDNPRCVNPAHMFTGDQGDNVRDCVAKGRHKNGNLPDGTGAFTTRALALNIIALYQAGLKQLDLARFFGVNRGVIADICVGRTWKSLPRLLRSGKRNWPFALRSAASKIGSA